jgi:hypothetical protein
LEGNPNGSEEEKEDQANKEGPESDRPTAPAKNQQVRQIKAAEKEAADC